MAVWNSSSGSLRTSTSSWSSDSCWSSNWVMDRAPGTWARMSRSPSSPDGWWWSTSRPAPERVSGRSRADPPHERCSSRGGPSAERPPPASPSSGTSLLLTRGARVRPLHPVVRLDGPVGGADRCRAVAGSHEGGVSSTSRLFARGPVRGRVHIPEVGARSKLATVRALIQNDVDALSDFPGGGGPGSDPGGGYVAHRVVAPLRVEGHESNHARSLGGALMPDHRTGTEGP